MNKNFDYPTAGRGRGREKTDAKWELGRLTLGKDERSGHRKTKTHKWICFERLAYYEDLEEQGRLVVLPCKVGTRVWVIGQNCDLCRDMYAEEPCLFGSCEYKEVFESVFGYGMIDNFGKTIFFTRAEAEDALQKEVEP